MIRKKVEIASLTTLKIGGPAKYFAQVSTQEELEEVVLFARSSKLPLIVLGGGSNVLVSDKGIDGLVLRLVNKGFTAKQEGDEILLEVGAGNSWDSVVKRAVARGWQGIECLSFIPGSCGAAPVQNIGAYGQEIADVLVSLDTYDVNKGGLLTMDKKECRFGYRTSFFKKSNPGRFIILRMTLRLRVGQPPQIVYESLSRFLNDQGIKKPSLRQGREAVIALRKIKLEDPVEVPNAGSFFKNPIVSRKKFADLERGYSGISSFPVSGKPDKVKLSAGWLIEACGWKGKMRGPVGFSQKHANILINPGAKGKASDVVELVKEVLTSVKTRFGFLLEPEVRFLGF